MNLYKYFWINAFLIKSFLMEHFAYTYLFRYFQGGHFKFESNLIEYLHDFQYYLHKKIRVSFYYWNWPIRIRENRSKSVEDSSSMLLTPPRILTSTCFQLKTDWGPGRLNITTTTNESRTLASQLVVRRRELFAIGLSKIVSHFYFISWPSLLD